MTLRLRYAPSPTGDLHIGSLRTVIFDWLVARQAEGVFMLRVEDTDQARLVEGALERQLEALRWMGLEPDEGVCLDDQGNIVEKGSYGPYTQSKRLDIYQKYAQILLDSGEAYRCFATAEELTEMRAAQQARGELPRYDGRYRNLPREESDARAAKGDAFVIRHRVPENQVVSAVDIIRGELSFNSKDVEDYVLMKSDGFPTYQLASVVDDHLMEITHVLRGEEWIPSLPKNLLLYASFGWQAPQFAHVPVILGPDGKKKLSKRDGDVSVLEYRDKGYLPEALFNALAFVGWSPGTEEEFFTKQELVQRFKLEKVQKSPAAFNFERLDYVSGWYIRHLSITEVVNHMRPYLEAEGFTGIEQAFLEKVAATLQERFKHFDETVTFSRFFFMRPEVNDALRTLVVPKKGNSVMTQTIMTQVVSLLEHHDNWSSESLTEILQAFITEHGYKNGEVLWPIRAALTGESASPGAYEMLATLGKAESIFRLKALAS